MSSEKRRVKLLLTVSGIVLGFGLAGMTWFVQTKPASLSWIGGAAKVSQRGMPMRYFEQWDYGGGWAVLYDGPTTVGHFSSPKFAVDVIFWSLLAILLLFIAYGAIKKSTARRT